MRRFDAMLWRSLGWSLLGVWALLLGFELIGALLGELDNLGDGDYGWGHMLLVLLLQVPRRAYNVFPMAAVIAFVLSLGGHAVRSELVALRALGISPLRIGASGSALLLLVCLPLMLMAETLSPWGEQQAQAIEMQATQKQVTLGGGGSLWAREGQDFFNARGGVRRNVDGRSVLEFTDVRVFSFDDDGRLQWLQTAAQADYRDDQGWHLLDVRRTVFAERSATLETFAEQQWDTALQPGAIAAGLTRPRYQSAAVLADQMEQLRRNGLDVRALQSAYWARWFYPFTLMALLLAALPFAFGQQRSGGFGQRLFVGIVFALVMRIVQPMLVSLAEAYKLDVRLAYLLPVLVLPLIGWVLLRRRL